MSYYPLILVFAGLIGTVNNILYIFQINYFIFDLINTITLNSMGLLNALLFLNTGAVKETMKEDLCSCCFSFNN